MAARRDYGEIFVISFVMLVVGATVDRLLPLPLRVERAIRLGVEGVKELEPLAERYGPARSSQFAEEWILRDFYQDRRDGVFLDVGANHYRDNSTTFYLESALGWRGIAVEPQQQFAGDYAAHRPRTTFVAVFASDVDDTVVPFFLPNDTTLNASGTRDFAEHGQATSTAIRVTSATLTTVLDRAGVTALDFLSMDIELAEPKALAGFDIDRFQPSLVCIEAHKEVRQAILDYFQAHGYVIVGKYLRMDSLNLYFRPIRSGG